MYPTSGRILREASSGGTAMPLLLSSTWASAASFSAWTSGTMIFSGSDCHDLKLEANHSWRTASAWSCSGVTPVTKCDGWARRCAVADV